MNFFEAINSVFSKFFQSSGRSVRSEYWYFILFTLIVGICLSFVDAEIFNLSWIDFLNNEEIGVTGSIFNLAILIPTITVCARRFHDIGRSGWWMLIPLTIIGIIPFIYWMCKEGDKGENRFGPVPLTSDRNGAPTNISTSSAATDNPINDGSQDVSSFEIPESKNSTTELEQELKKIDDMFKKSLITEEEKNQMRNKILGLG